MPVDQEIRVFAAPRGASGSGTAEPQAAGAGTLLVVGAGGGLGHAFLESLLLDPELRRAFARIVLVDSDRYEDSNANRQTLMGSIEAVGKAKAVVTKDEIERRWPRGEPRPSIVAVPEPIAREHVADFRPDVVALLADNFHARDVAYRALQDLDGPRVAICAGTDFIYGQTRAVLLGEGSCLDHGPEHLGESALAEDGRGPSCGASPTPANVLTNALCGAHAALQARRWVTTGSVEPRQVLIHWMLPERARLGPVWDPCSCATAKGAAA
jgi:molybdopterin/thiamine biosynthesis adenylyltransferase